MDHHTSDSDGGNESQGTETSCDKKVGSHAESLGAVGHAATTNEEEEHRAYCDPKAKKVATQAIFKKHEKPSMSSLKYTDLEQGWLVGAKLDKENAAHGHGPKSCKFDKGGSIVGSSEGTLTLLELREGIMPLPSPPHRARRSRHPEGPGAYAVATPRFLEDGVETPTQNEESVSEEAFTSHNPHLVSVAATLSPLEGPSGATRERGGSASINTTNHCSENGEDIESSHHQSSMVVDATIVEEERQPQTERKQIQRILSIAAILVLMAIAVVLALGLAGLLDVNRDDNYSSQAHATIEAQTNGTGSPASAISRQSSPALLEIQARGFLTCHYSHIPGFMFKDESGEVNGFNAVWCKAIAAALFGLEDINSRIQYIDWFPYANNEDADITPVGITPTMTRTTYVEILKQGLSFSNPFSYDGLRVAGDPFFVACAEDGWKHLAECKDLRVCALAGTTHYTFATSVLPPRLVVPVDQTKENIAEKLANGECNAFIAKHILTPESTYRRLGYTGNYTVGLKLFTNEPWALVSMKRDPQWVDFINAVLYSIMTAEERNITQAIAHRFPVTHVFGRTYEGIFRNAVAAVGNLQEIYQQHLPHLARGAMNRINDGSSGMMRSYPFGDNPVLTGERELGPNLQRVLERGRLRCGVQYHRPGFATKLSENGLAAGMDVDFCRMLAAGLFGGIEALELVALEGDSFKKLANKDVDVVAGAVWNIENEANEPTTGMGFAFSQPYFYGPGQQNLCLATSEDDPDWSAYIFWIVTASIYAEEKSINQRRGNDMPLIHVYGTRLQRMLRDAVLWAGNYGEIYGRNLNATIFRAGRNLLNVNPHGPQHYPMPGLI